MMLMFASGLTECSFDSRCGFAITVCRHESTSCRHIFGKLVNDQIHEISWCKFHWFSFLIFILWCFGDAKICFGWLHIAFTNVLWNVNVIGRIEFYDFRVSNFPLFSLRFFNEFDVPRCSDEVLFWFSLGFCSKSWQSRIHVVEEWFWRLDKYQNHEISLA